MTMREEAKVAAVKTLEAKGYTQHATDTQAENFDGMGDEMLGLALKAVLTVIDQYEEVEVEECRPDNWFVLRSSHWLRMPDDKQFGQQGFGAVPRTILMKKPAPKQKPDLPELARRAVKAWREGPRREERDAMEKLAEAAK